MTAPKRMLSIMFCLQQEECDVFVHSHLRLHKWSLRLPSLKDNVPSCHSAEMCQKASLYNPPRGLEVGFKSMAVLKRRD